MKPDTKYADWAVEILETTDRDLDSRVVEAIASVAMVYALLDVAQATREANVR